MFIWPILKSTKISLLFPMNNGFLILKTPPKIKIFQVLIKILNRREQASHQWLTTQISNSIMNMLLLRRINREDWLLMLMEYRLFKLKRIKAMKTSYRPPWLHLLRKILVKREITLYSVISKEVNIKDINGMECDTVMVSFSIKMEENTMENGSSIKCKESENYTISRVN